MQKNWYVIYTKSGCEKKVAAILTKKKIENFLPVNRKNIQYLRKAKVVNEPLFKSYVFARIEEKEIPFIESQSHVLNLVYWRNKRVTIQEDEIRNIREFAAYHQDIRLERINIDFNGESSLIDTKSFSVDGKIIMIKKRRVKVNLPSLGYAMVATLEKEDIIGIESLIRATEISPQ